MSEPANPHAAMPRRLEPPSWINTCLFALFLGFFLWSLQGAGLSLSELISGLPNMAQVAGEMMPPATDRLLPVAESILVTFQMALI